MHPSPTQASLIYNSKTRGLLGMLSKGGKARRFCLNRHWVVSLPYEKANLPTRQPAGHGLQSVHVVFFSPFVSYITACDID